MLSIFSSLIVVAILTAISLRKKGIEWIDDDNRSTYIKWVYASLSSAAIFGIFLAILTSLFSAPEYWKITVSTLSSIVIYVFVLSIWTDHKFRFVDRVLLRVAIIISITMGFIQLLTINNETFIVLYIVSLLMSLAIMFTPIGASDSRAYMLLFAASIPVLGLNLTFYTLISGIALIMIYGIIFAIKSKSMKVSIPLVPYILAPYVVFSTYGTLILI